MIVALHVSRRLTNLRVPRPTSTENYKQTKGIGEWTYPTLSDGYVRKKVICKGYAQGRLTNVQAKCDGIRQR